MQTVRLALTLAFPAIVDTSTCRAFLHSPQSAALEQTHRSTARTPATMQDLEAQVPPIAAGNAADSKRQKKPATNSPHPQQLQQQLRPRSYCTWLAAFYAPLFLSPQYTRWLMIYRNWDQLALSSVLKGSMFGLLQDAAVFLQTLVLVHFVMAPADKLASNSKGDPSECVSGVARVFRSIVRAIATCALVLAFLWATLACIADFCLLITFHPRLNRGFVKMYMKFSDQFSASLFNPEVLTTSVLLGLATYVVSLLFWTYAIIQKKVELPRFGSPFRSQTQARNPARSLHSRQSIRTSSARGGLGWVLEFVTTSVPFRCLAIGVLVFASALNATIALDGNGNDIYLMSNAMFSLEMENFLRPPTKSHAAFVMSQQESHTKTLSPFMKKTLGVNEYFELAANGSIAAKYPFWRRTIGYTGERRFALQNVTTPNIILLNLESWRSVEVGVVGGREKKKAFNQTVTPFFDDISSTGILFRQHYTPCVQTSRTLLSTLFGILPSLTDESAVSTYSTSQLRFYGLTHILKELRGYHTTFWSTVSLAWEDWAGFLGKQAFDELVDDVVFKEFLSEERKKSMTEDDSFSWGYHDAVSLEALENYLEMRSQNESERNTPVFMDVYTISSHDPWSVPSTFKPSTNYSAYITAHNEKYVNAMNYVDQALGRFVANLRSKGLMKNTIMIIEGDHGYGRMEHDNPTIVASYVYDEGLHIPMMILADDFLAEQDKGMAIDDVTSQVDMLATIADFLGLENFMQHGVGQSMMRRNEGGEDRAVALENPFYGHTKGLRHGELKYGIYGSGEYRVYNLTQDPGEHSPVEKGQFPDGVSNNKTREALSYVNRLVDAFAYMYERNGFRPAEGESNGTHEADLIQKESTNSGSAEEVSPTVAPADSGLASDGAVDGAASSSSLNTEQLEIVSTSESEPNEEDFPARHGEEPAQEETSQSQEDASITVSEDAFAEHEEELTTEETPAAAQEDASITVSEDAFAEHEEELTTEETPAAAQEEASTFASENVDREAEPTHEDASELAQEKASTPDSLPVTDQEAESAETAADDVLLEANSLGGEPQRASEEQSPHSYNQLLIHARWTDQGEEPSSTGSLANRSDPTEPSQGLEKPQLSTNAVEDHALPSIHQKPRQQDSANVEAKESTPQEDPSVGSDQSA